MSLLDTLDPEFKPAAQALFDLAKRAGVHPRVTSAFRTKAKQEAIYRAWQQGRSRYPAAIPGSSAHEYGLAFDMVVDGAINQADVGTVWQDWGGKYGGEEDPVHFEQGGFSPRAPSERAAPSGPGGDDNARKVLARATDLLLSFVPTPLRGIVNMAGLSNAIWSLSGRQTPVLLYWIAHPQEFFDAAYDLWWAIVKSYF